MKEPVSHPALKTWDGLNDALRHADEKFCDELMKLEQDGRKRAKFISRIHSRKNKVRAERERKELMSHT